MAKLVGIREGARQLGISHTTLSRQVARGLVPNHGTATAPLIDLSEARKAREAAPKRGPVPRYRSKSEVVSFRIEPETRTALEASAATHKLRPSQEAERLLHR